MARGIRVILLGPPGAGKGTQAKLLQEHFTACKISTGDILRTAVAQRSHLGKAAEQYIQRGDLVPDNLIVGIVEDRLRQKDCANGFILDGFPRTIPQAESLDALLQASGRSLDGVLSVCVPKAVIVERLAGRRTCSNCGALYHVTFEPPKTPGVCDRCGGDLYQRVDDREETVAARIDVYQRQTRPLESYYRDRGLLRDVDGLGEVDQIRRRISNALGGEASQ